jgi:hypothetical protein
LALPGRGGGRAGRVCGSSGASRGPWCEKDGAGGYGRDSGRGDGAEPCERDAGGEKGRAHLELGEARGGDRRGSEHCGRPATWGHCPVQKRGALSLLLLARPTLVSFSAALSRAQCTPLFARGRWRAGSGKLAGVRLRGRVRLRGSVGLRVGKRGLLRPRRRDKRGEPGDHWGKIGALPPALGGRPRLVESVGQVLRPPPANVLKPLGDFATACKGDIAQEEGSLALERCRIDVQRGHHPLGEREIAKPAGAREPRVGRSQNCLPRKSQDGVEPHEKWDGPIPNGPTSLAPFIRC